MKTEPKRRTTYVDAKKNLGYGFIKPVGHGVIYLHEIQMLTQLSLKLHLFQPTPQSDHCRYCWQRGRPPSAVQEQRLVLKRFRSNFLRANIIEIFQSLLVRTRTGTLWLMD